MPDFFDPSELPQFETWLDEEIKDEHAQNLAFYYVLEISGKIMACGGFYLNPEKKQAGMAWGMVSKTYHKNGFGKQLLEFRKKKIWSLSPQAQIMLDTSQYSYPFFEKMGFKLTAITKDFYGEGLDRYDMTCELR